MSSLKKKRWGKNKNELDSMCPSQRLLCGDIPSPPLPSEAQDNMLGQEANQPF